MVNVTVNVGRWMGGGAGEEKGSIASDQLDRKSLEEVSGDLVLVSASGGGHHGAEPGDDQGSVGVPPTQGFDWEGDKNEASGCAGVEIKPVLLVVSDIESMTWGDGGPRDDVGRSLERTDDCDVPGRVFPILPTLYQDIPRSLLRPIGLSSQEMSLLSLGGKAGLTGSLKEDVAERVVASDALTLLSAADGVVSKNVGEAATGDTGARGLEDGETQSVSNSGDILGIADVEAEGEVRDGVQPISTMREGEGVESGLVAIVRRGVQEEAVGAEVDGSGENLLSGGEGLVRSDRVLGGGVEEGESRDKMGEGLDVVQGVLFQGGDELGGDVLHD